MAFNFNWSPLMADASFYTRAQDLLTAALNKSPKPPIIVDDIIVTELNLGSIPPELEILEIGDLAEDRFRGIFKMSYTGDAFLTLKTRVQANPLNTYLMTRPSFASPLPLAAATPLTIPLQITLSDFKLSGFVILVFSKQKGITVVFRNDPLESLKVSSTFDSIPFVRDFLQREIEAQLRILFMDELPAIIHRLSLRLWVPEYRAKEEMQNQMNTTPTPTEGPGHDPLASPPQDPVDSSGNALDESEIASLSLDSAVETHSLFSQKNLLSLATLTDSQRTLSLFTPSIQQVVYRAWTSSDQNDLSASVMSPISPALSRTQSQTGSMSTFMDNASTISAQSRTPTGPTQSFSSYGLSLGAGRHSKAHARRRKKRVVDLRSRPTTPNDSASVSVSDESTYTESASAPSVSSAPLPAVHEQPDDPVTPPLSPESDQRLPAIPEKRRMSLSRSLPRRDISSEILRDRAEPSEPPRNTFKTDDVNVTVGSVRPAPHQESGPSSGPTRQLSAAGLPFPHDSPTGSSIVDQVLVEKLAGEIARRMRDEKLMAPNSCGSFWDHGPPEETPPPAYGQ
jgi:distribution and morphology protein 34